MKSNPEIENDFYGKLWEKSQTERNGESEMVPDLTAPSKDEFYLYLTHQSGVTAIWYRVKFSLLYKMYAMCLWVFENKQHLN